MKWFALALVLPNVTGSDELQPVASLVCWIVDQQWS